MKCSKCNAKLIGPDLICPNCDYRVDTEGKKENKFEAITKYAKMRKNYKPQKGFAAIVRYYKGTFDFNGYSNREEYWTQQLYLTLISVPLLIFLFFFSEYITFFSSLGHLAFWTFIALVVFSTFPNVSATIRRLNDAGYSGKMYFMGYIPIVGNFILLFATLEPSEE